MEPLNSAGQNSSRLSSFCDDKLIISKRTVRRLMQKTKRLPPLTSKASSQHYLNIKDGSRIFLSKGFRYSPNILQSVIALAQEDSSKLFEFHPSDIIICSCMKTGTTWLKSLAFPIATRTGYAIDDSSASNTLTQHETNSRNPLLKWVSHDLIPFLEIDVVRDKKRKDPKLPKVLITASGCKIIYIWRDPKDTFISFWLFVNKVKSKLPVENDPISSSKAFDLFLRGISVYGPYWDHVLGYWKSSQDFPNRVLLMKYEDMIEDTSSFYVKRIADFKGYPFSKEEESQGVMENIGNLCSFENLSQLEVNKTGDHWPNERIPIENSTYFRKGKIGDWKNYLTLEMGREIETITREKLGNTGLIF